MNYEKDLFKKLKAEGFSVGCFKGDSWDECSAEEATELSLTNWEQGIVAKIIKVPKVKEVTFEWLMAKFYQESQYKSLVEHCKKLVKGTGISMYATSYGIGFFVLFGSVHESVKELKDILDQAGIIYTNEFSEARYVYRFKISKSENNVKKLQILG